MVNNDMTNTERRVLEAAIRVFVRRGKSGARMQEIADEAHINKASLHYYFRSKDRLYEAVFRLLFQEFSRILRPVLDPATPPPDAIKQVISIYISQLRKHPELPLFILHELSEGGESLRSVVREILMEKNAEVPELLTMKIEQGIREGVFRNVDVDQVVISIIACSVFFFIGYPMVSLMKPELAGRKEEFLDRRAEAVFDLLYYGLKPRTEGES